MSNVQSKMTVARWCFFTLVIALSFPIAVAAEPQFAVEVIAPSPKTALPGELITVVFVVINRGTEPDTYNLRAVVPEGFQVIGIAPPTAALAPGAQEPVFVTLLVSQDTSAETYTIALEALSQSDPLVKAGAATVITVEKTAGVIVRAPDQQEVDPGTEVVLAFSVTNRGNIIDGFRLDASTPRGFPTKVEPALVELLPAETRTILVSVSIPEDVPSGFEAVTLTAVSLRSEGIHDSGTTTLIILPPEAAKVPTELFLRAPAELSLRTTVALTTGALMPLVSFFSYATLPEEQRFSVRLKVSEMISSQIGVREFLFTSQRGAFFLYLGDLPRLPLIYNPLPRRGVEVGFTNAFSLLAAFGDQDGNLTQEQRAMALNFFGGNLRASLARLSVAGSAPYVLSAANFLSAILSAEGAMAETSAGVRRLFFMRAMPSFNTMVIGGEYLLVEPNFPTSLGIPSALADTQRWTIFGSGSVQTLAFSLLVSGGRTDLFSDPAVQEITSMTSQGRLTMRSLAPGWPSVFFDITFVSQYSNDPPFAPLSTREDSKSLTIADVSSPISYVLSFQNTIEEDVLASTQIQTFELTTSVIVGPIAGVEGLSLGLNNRATFQLDGLGTPIQRRVTAIGRLAFTTTRVSAFLSAGLMNDLLYPYPMSFFGSFSFTLFGPVGVFFAFAFAEPSSLSFTIEARTKFDMPFEGVVIRGRLEGTLFMDLDNDGQRDHGEPGVAEALLRLGSQLARTDAQGYFRFPPLDPGTYNVEIARAPLGLVPTVPIPIVVSIAAGQVISLEIPMRSVGIIRGRVFDDKNRNGQPDPDEPGLANVRILVVGPTSAEVRSSANGQYTIQVPPGNYTVTVDRTTLPKRYEPTTPLSVTISVQIGQAIIVDFGAYEVPRPILFAPIADFTFTPAQPKVGERVTFDASASTDSDGQIVRYEWDFDNDGRPDAVGKIVEWVFTNAGNFPVKLTVTDNDDLRNSLTKIVPVQP